MTKLSEVMKAVLAFAPEAIAHDENDGNIIISLNLRLVRLDELEPFEDENPDDPE
jgi:hypothetical protein